MPYEAIDPASRDGSSSDDSDKQGPSRWPNSPRNKIAWLSGGYVLVGLHFLRIPT